MVHWKKGSCKVDPGGITTKKKQAKVGNCPPLANLCMWTDKNEPEVTKCQMKPKQQISNGDQFDYWLLHSWLCIVRLCSWHLTSLAQVADSFTQCIVTVDLWRNCSHRFHGSGHFSHFCEPYSFLLLHADLFPMNHFPKFAGDWTV